MFLEVANLLVFVVLTHWSSLGFLLEVSTSCRVLLSGFEGQEEFWTLVWIVGQ